ncbi:hypothetical protein [Geofilum rubicundum]|uniref:Uncharacterized protein n=1 Tax=Geofilum rubicundum JCM 15548 TaxID=1236989 RepID=A0A0E9LRH0_9BACT|nr:hypothetical protein [Geofilum rubicundum]GAO28187.1 hypothetical protein JCM15548_252 [Geofilum rubicundum JCM 15548]
MEQNPQAAACVPTIKDYSQPDFFEYAALPEASLINLDTLFAEGACSVRPKKTAGNITNPVPFSGAAGLLWSSEPVCL